MKTSGGLANVTSLSTIPAKPTAIYCGKLQSREFTEAAYAFATALREIDQRYDRERWYRDHEHRTTAELEQRIAALIEPGGEARAGAIAAIANWIAQGVEGSSAEPNAWIPLAVHSAGGELLEPHPLASLFEIHGTPCTITPDLVAQQWSSGGIAPISIELMRALGRPITREQFDRLRAGSANADE